MAIQLVIEQNFENIKEIWLSLEKEAAMYVFQNYYWLKTWYETIGKSENIIPYIVIVRHNNINCAILPLCMKKVGFIKCLTWMGGIVTDYHGPIVNKTCEIPFDFELIISQLKKSLPHFDYILFEKQPGIIKGIRNPFITGKCQPNKSHAYSANLGISWDQYYNKVTSSKTRYNNKRNMKLLAESGEVNFFIAENDEERKEITNAMIQHKINRYRATKAKNMFDNDHYKNFYLKLSNCNNDGNTKVHISALLVKDHIASTHWGIYDGERFYYLMPTYTDGELSKYSPGKLLQLELMRWCIDHGLPVFDFTVGGDNYKHDWCDTELQLYKYTQVTGIKGAVLKGVDLLDGYIRSNKLLLSLAQRFKRIIRTWLNHRST